MASRLADRLIEARRRRFVGRAAELALFQTALSAAELPFNVLHVYGPGGVGKTTLLEAFAGLCLQEQVPAVALDARAIDPSPDAFVVALGLAMDLPAGQSPLDALVARPERRVVLIDTYELLTPLDNWLRGVFLPQLPEQTLIVLAGRHPLAPAWRSDPGWQHLVRVVPLRNLNREDGRAYLARRDVPEDQHAAVLDFTHGHPLALALVADAFAQRGALLFRAEATPDIVRTLVEQFVQKVPGPAQRAALEACSLVRLTTEGVLGGLLAMPDAHDLFDWLRSLSFIEAGDQGIFPHDLAREALAADLRWRHPDWHAELHRRARAYYANRLALTRGQEQQRVLFDYVYLHRDNPLMRPYLDWQETGSTMPDVPRADDRDALVAMVTEHEGPESATWLRYWLDRPAAEVVVYRDASGQPSGFVVMIGLQAATPEERTADPAAHAAWQYLARHAPLRPGERATLFRFWMARDTYQDVSAVQSLIFGRAAQHYLTSSGLAFSFFTTADPDFWAPMFTHVDLPRLPEADFVVAGRRFGIFAHDWRATSPLAWLSLLGERELAAERQQPAPPTPTATALVLSEEAFATAVRQALRDYVRPDALRQSPLLRSRLVLEHTAPDAKTADRVGALRDLLREAAATLQHSPRDAKRYQALYHTYMQPAPTQERAAELLDMPFSTYRRHLTAGVARVVELLWRCEVEGTEV